MTASSTGGALDVARLVVGDERSNCWILSVAREAIVVDPGAEGERIVDLVREADLRPIALVATHAHADHLGAAAELVRAWRIPLILHAADKTTLRRANLLRIVGGRPPIEVPVVERWVVAEDASLELGGTAVRLLHTPGHTPGGMTVHVVDRARRSHLFTGDTLFRGALGRTDLPGGDVVALTGSLRMLARFPGDALIHPGHGEGTVLEAELDRNVALRELVC